VDHLVGLGLVRRGLCCGRDDRSCSTASPSAAKRATQRCAHCRDTPTSLPYLADCDPLTGQLIRSSKQTACRYERDRPGELVHMDVKKIGKIPDGGGWRAHGRPATTAEKTRQPKIGYDYVHSLVDDHSRLAYSEILTDEIGTTCAVGSCSALPPTSPPTASRGLSG